MGKFVIIEFEYDDKPVVARVYKGTTLAGGDDHSDVISLNVEGLPYLSKAEKILLTERALIAALECE